MFLKLACLLATKLREILFAHRLVCLTVYPATTKKISESDLKHEQKIEGVQKIIKDQLFKMIHK